MELKGRVAIITGGGQGIGKAIALTYAREGADVVVAARSRDKVEAVAKQISGMGRRAIGVPTDVSKRGDVEFMVAQTVERFGKIDILVNNAGIAGPNAAVIEMKEEEWDEVMAVNVKGTMLCSQAALKYMIPQKSGRIINMSSVGGIRGYPRRSPYGVSKWGINGFTQALAIEVGPYNIHVNAICPGPVAGERLNTIIMRQAKAAGVSPEEIEDGFKKKSPLGKIVSEEEVAELAVFLASERSNSITGQIINIMAGYEIGVP